MLNKNFWDNPNIKNKKERFLIFFELLIIIFCLTSLAFTGRIFPNTYVAGVNLGGKSEKQAIEILGQKVRIPETIRLVNSIQTFDITPDSIDLSLDLNASAQKALGIHRTGNIIYDFGQRILSFFKRKDLGLELTKNDERFYDLIAVISDQVETSPFYPSLKITDNKAVLDKGSVGYELDKNLLMAKIGYNFSFANDSDIEIPLLKIDPRLNQEEEARFLKRGENLLNKKLTISYEDQTFNYQKNDLFNLLDPNNTYSNQKISDIIKGVADKLNREPVNSVFVFEEGRVKEFTPSKDGVEVNEDLLSQMIVGNLRTLEETDTQESKIAVPVSLTPPQVTTSDVNNLGIKELIGTGVSYFAGSIPGRIHNINLAASKFMGVLVAPGETFSFTKTVGDISAQTGYKQAYVISGGKTILGDGGGVCQVSTTLFRAVLNAGLEITRRLPHSYRVSYYELDNKPGIDATVYSGDVDFRFKNDTDNYVLIYAQADSENLAMKVELYGTSDGRTSEIVDHVTWNPRPALPTQYIPTTELPPGKLQQVDWSAPGISAKFTNIVKDKDGNIKSEVTYTSNYRPWAAKFLQGI